MLRQVHGGPQLHLPEAEDARPNGIITVGSTFTHAFTCDREHYELATTVINSSELLWLREASTPAVPDYNKPTPSMAFYPLEETKTVGIDLIR